jgi:NTP pyrophosphatase (non-canonical NTP hydrolase)
MNLNSKLVLKENSSLKELQKYVEIMEEIRGFTEETSLSQCLRLGEEVGELFKEVRKAEGLSIDSVNSKFSDVSDELTDVFIFLLSIANRYGIDLEEAFRRKEEKNKKREWK